MRSSPPRWQRRERAFLHRRIFPPPTAIRRSSASSTNRASSTSRTQSCMSPPVWGSQRTRSICIFATSSTNFRRNARPAHRITERTKPPAMCICQGKVDTKRHHSFRSPVRSCTELGFYSPEWLQVARNYSNEHTRREVWEHP